jgi:serine/threonine-protein kinase
VTAVHDTRTLVVPRVVDKPAKTSAPRKSRRGLVAGLLLVALALLALFGGYYLGSFRYTHTPDLAGLTAAAAETKVKAAGLEFKRVDEFSETVAAGKEIRQDPKAGARIKKSGTVTVFVSKGPDRRPVPDVRGKDVGFATSLLQQRGLKVSSQATEFSSTVPDGKVIRTDPAAGARLKPGGSVKLFVSKGPQPIAVPNLAGKTQSEATSTLTGLGFKVAVTTTYSDTVPKGVVISNDPSSGTAPKGSTVTLQVSKGPEFVQVPNLRYDTTSDATRRLQELGLGVRVKTEVKGGNGQLVLDTDPKPGKKGHVGTVVTLLVY